MTNHTSIALLDQGHELYSNAFVAFMNLPRRKKDISKQTFTFYMDKQEITCSIYTNKTLPYGSYARLILIWLITEIKLHNDAIINVGSSLNDFIKKLNLKKGGKQYKLILEQLDLLSSLAFSFESKTINNKKQYTSFKNFFIFDSGEFVENLKDKSIETCTLDVTHQFFELAQNSFPIAAKDLIQLINFPLAIDVYLWLTPQLFIAQKQQRKLTITWSQLSKNFSQYTTENKHSKINFKKDLKKAIGKIVELNANLHCHLDTKQGLVIFPSSNTFVKQKAID